MTVMTKEDEAGIALGTEEGNVEIMCFNDSFKSNANNDVKDGKVFVQKHLRDTLVRFLTPNTYSLQ